VACSRAMPHLGQTPGRGCLTSGVHRAGIFDALFMDGRRGWCFGMEISARVRLEFSEAGVAAEVVFLALVFERAWRANGVEHLARCPSRVIVMLLL